MAGSMQLTGDKELNKLLMRLPDEMTNKVVAKAVSSGARKVATAAKRKIVGHDAIETGLLKSSLRLQTKKDKRKGYVRTRVWPSKKVQGVGPDGRKRVPMYYAHLVEFGHRVVNRWGAHGHVPARPFLRPALDENRKKIEREFSSNVRKFMDKEVAKAEAKGKR